MVTAHLQKAARNILSITAALAWAMMLLIIIMTASRMFLQLDMLPADEKILKTYRQR